MIDGVKVALVLMEGIILAVIAIILVRKTPASCHIYTCIIIDKLQNHKWENAFTVDKRSWGFRREATYSDFLTIEEILEELVSTVRYLCIVNTAVHIY